MNRTGNDVTGQSPPVPAGIGIGDQLRAVDEKYLNRPHPVSCCQVLDENVERSSTKTGAAPENGTICPPAAGRLPPPIAAMQCSGIDHDPKDVSCEKNLTAECCMEYQKNISLKTCERGFCVQKIDGYCVNRCRQGDPPDGGGLIAALQRAKHAFQF